MTRFGLIEEREGVLSPEDGFILSSQDGVETVALLSIIGKGGTAIAYKGLREKKGVRSACIVKEYYPAEKAEDSIYNRKEPGDKISIAGKYREAELKLQEENVQRELKSNHDIYFNPDDIKYSDFNNFPYSYSAEFFCRLGDSSYIVLDSSEGETLHKMIKQGKITEKFFVHYAYQLLVVVEHLHKKGFVHCDIKPENLWVRGEGANQNMCLLDFGSTFRLADYQVLLDTLTKEGIMEAAWKIIQNESLGSSTDHYRSSNIAMVDNHKRLFMTTDCSLERAVKLVEAVNRIGVKDDLFSVVKVMEVLVSALSGDSRSMIEEEWERIQRKNVTEGYGSAEELREEVSILETILQKGAHPRVLQRGLEKKYEKLVMEDFDETLLCEVE